MSKYNFILLSIIFIFAVILHLVIANEQAEFDLVKYVENWRPEYEDVKADQSTYFARDGTCGWRDGDRYVAPTRKFPGFKAKGSLDNFHRLRFGRVCGDSDYELIKHCAMVSFFDNNEPEKSVVFTGDEQQKESALGFVEGCFVCDNQAVDASSLSIKIKLKWTWPAGSFFTGCKEAEYTAYTLDISDKEIVSNSAMFPSHLGIAENGLGSSFVLTAMFFQRYCEGLFSADEIYTSFDTIVLEVEHSCGGNKAKLNIHLPTLVPKDHHQHIAELRGLLLNLDTGKWLQQKPGSYDYEEGISWNSEKEEEEDK